MKVLVTGGAGFIGSHLVDKLIKQGHKVIVIDNLSTGRKENLTPAFFKKGGANSNAKFYQLDIQSPKISEIFKKEKIEIVFHLAAQIDVRKSVEEPIEDAKNNILGSLNILENCKKFGVKKIIFSSTGGAIYGDTEVVPTSESYPALPLSPYGVAKLTTEKYLNYYYKVFELPYISLRLANVYGPRQNSEGEIDETLSHLSASSHSRSTCEAGVVAIFCHKLLKNEQPFIFGDGNQTRDYIFVDDVVEAAILAAENSKVGIFNVGTAKETSVNEIFAELKRIIGSSCKEIYSPSKMGEQKRSCLDCSRAKQELKWSPKYNLEQGLKKTLNFFKKIKYK